MRGSARLVVAVCAVLLGAGVVPSTSAAAGAGAPRPPGGTEGSPGAAAARGLVHDGLRPARAGGGCPSGFELGPVGSGRCSHGPDPAPPGVDVRRPRSVAALAAETSSTLAGAAAAEGSLLCLGDGTGGKRVQAIYAVAGDRPDRFASVAPLIPQWARATDAAFNTSAAATGGERHVRWVTNPDCTLSVLKVVLSPTGDDSLADTEDELVARGFDRSDRKYLVWADANVYCGIAGIYGDHRPGQDNANNGIAQAPPLFARVDSGCWGRSASVEAHELMHTLGGVQLSAPNSSGGWHCTDESDRMCYDDDGDPSTAPLTATCPSSHEPLFDCNHDDYFSTAPAPGSYLATHWNTATSAFLTSTPAPVVDLTVSVPPTTTPTTAPPPPPPPTTTPPTTAPPATTPTPPPPPPVPAAAPGGYRLVGTDGRSFGFGDGAPLGSTGALPVDPAQPVVDAAATPDGSGAWAVTGGGAVFTVGPAPFLGSTGGARLNQPIVGMAATPSGKGYWLVASDGGIFAFGDARFFGSTGAIRLNQPIAGMAATPSGDGYWLVASDGGIFAFGGARFFGSTGAMRLNRPIVGMAATPSGHGYWLVASDGGIFAFGGAPFHGSTGAIRLNQPIVGMAASATGAGYRFVASDGGVFSFGDARFLGSAAAHGSTITAMVAPAR